MPSSHEFFRLLWKFLSAEHEKKSAIISDLLSKCYIREDGSYVILKDHVDLLKENMNKTYGNLDKKEKDILHENAMKTINLIIDAGLF